MKKSISESYMTFEQLVVQIDSHTLDLNDWPLDVLVKLQKNVSESKLVFSQFYLHTIFQVISTLPDLDEDEVII